MIRRYLGYVYLLEVLMITLILSDIAEKYLRSATLPANLAA
ncbi:hypothetical protein GAPWKB30_1739 [Gilliamella apicola]|nr:hypothetical protein GAPWKB30_1739 [Gilliamella apicola]